MKLIKTAYKKGNGPGELLSCQFKCFGNQFSMLDFVKKQYCEFNLNDVLCLGESFPEPVELNDVGISVSSAVYSKCSQDLVLLNPNSFKNKDLGINNDEPRLFLKSEKLPSGNSKRIYNCYNVEQGNLFIENTTDRIFYISKSRPEIEIFNQDLQLEGYVSIPCDIKPDYGVVHKNVLAFKGKVPLTTSNVALDENTIYLSFNGGFFENSERELDTHIIKLSPDIKFCGCYYFNQYINGLSPTTTPGVFYASGYDRESKGVVLWRLYCSVP